MTIREFARLCASALAVPGGKGKQGANFVEGESEFAGTADKGKCPRFHRAIDPSPIGGARRRGEHLDALIISDGFDIHAGPSGQFADGQGCRWLRGNGAHRKKLLILWRLQDVAL
jgi:hypothetical protein